MFGMLVPFLFIPVTLHAEGDPEVGKRYFGMCASCHGSNAEGNEEIGAPRLKGQHDWYLIRQLKNFKQGIRGTHEEDKYGHQMRQMAMTLKDDEAIEDVVAYISSLNE